MHMTDNELLEAARIAVREFLLDAMDASRSRRTAEFQDTGESLGVSNTYMKRDLRAGERPAL